MKFKYEKEKEIYTVVKKTIFIFLIVMIVGVKKDSDYLF
jgi:hypothetical protein